MNRSPEPAFNNTGHVCPASPIDAIGDLPSTPSISFSLGGSVEHFLHVYARDYRKLLRNCYGAVNEGVVPTQVAIWPFTIKIYRNETDENGLSCNLNQAIPEWKIQCHV